MDFYIVLESVIVMSHKISYFFGGSQATYQEYAKFFHEEHGKIFPFSEAEFNDLFGAIKYKPGSAFALIAGMDLHVKDNRNIVFDIDGCWSYCNVFTGMRTWTSELSLDIFEEIESKDLQLAIIFNLDKINTLWSYVRENK